MAISGKEAVKWARWRGRKFALCFACHLFDRRISAQKRGRGHAFRSGEDRAERRLQIAGKHRGAAADRAGDDGRCRRQCQCRAVQLLQRRQLGAAGRGARYQPGRFGRRRMEGHGAQHPRHRRIRRQPSGRGARRAHEPSARSISRRISASSKGPNCTRWPRSRSGRRASPRRRSASNASASPAYRSGPVRPSKSAGSSISTSATISSIPSGSMSRPTRCG